MLAKHMTVPLKDSTFADILTFLNNCDTHGRAIVTVLAEVRRRVCGRVYWPLAVLPCPVPARARACVAAAWVTVVKRARSRAR